MEGFKFPSLLVLDIKFNIDKEESIKNSLLSIDIEKSKLEDFNNDRESLGKKLIEMQDIETVLKNVVVDKEKLEISIDDKMQSNLEKTSLDSEKLEQIKSLMIVSKKLIDVDSFNRKIYLYHKDDYKKYITDNSELLFDSSFKDILKNNILKELGRKNFDEINKQQGKFTPLYHTLLNENLKQIKNSFNQLNESKLLDFCKDDNLLIYLPDSTLTEIPVNFYGEKIKVDSIDFKLSLPSKEEYDKNKLIEDSVEVLDSSRVILEYSSNDPNDWRSLNILNNKSVIETPLYPKIIVNENGELATSKPVEKKEYYLRLLYGINKNLFIPNSLEVGL